MLETYHWDSCTFTDVGHQQTFKTSPKTPVRTSGCWNPHQFFSADAAAVSESSPTPRWTSKHFEAPWICHTISCTHKRLGQSKTSLQIPSKTMQQGQVKLDFKTKHKIDSVPRSFMMKLVCKCHHSWQTLKYLTIQLVDPVARWCQGFYHGYIAHIITHTQILYNHSYIYTYIYTYI